LQPTDVGYLLLAQALQRSGRGSEAEQALAQGMRISRDPDQARLVAVQVSSEAGLSGN
jgi:cytochrome c-type biogenesis protein CcmH/NrfG